MKITYVDARGVEHAADVSDVLLEGEGGRVAIQHVAQVRIANSVGVCTIACRIEDHGSDITPDSTTRLRPIAIPEPA